MANMLSSPIKMENLNIEQDEANDPNKPKRILHDFHLDFLDQELDTFRQQGLLTDMVVISGDQKFHAHKLLLAIYSSHIKRTVLSGNSVLDLSDVNPEVVSSLLSFIYKGEVEVKAELLDDLLAVGARLEVTGLYATGIVKDDNNGQSPKKRAPKRKRTPSEQSSSPNKKSKPIPAEEIERFEKKEEEFIKTGDSFVCNYCYFTFGSKPTVIRHVQLHTGTAPNFSCFRCNNYQTRHKHHLKNHFLKAHGVEGKAFDVIWKKRQTENSQEDVDNPTPGPSNKTPAPTSSTPGPSTSTPGPSNTSTPIPKTNKKTGNGRKHSFSKRIKNEPMDLMDKPER